MVAIENIDKDREIKISFNPDNKNTGHNFLYYGEVCPHHLQ
jgi:hypothetical protein